jgi:trans-aconitate methyltransferase
MLEKATIIYTHIQFIVALKNWKHQRKVKLFFLNKALLLLGNPNRLFLRLLQLLPKGSWFADQMPQNFELASHTSITEIIESGPWA